MHISVSTYFGGISGNIEGSMSVLRLRKATNIRRLWRPRLQATAHTQNDAYNGFISLEQGDTARSSPGSALHEKLFAVKDNFCTSSLATSCGSNTLAGMKL